MWRRIFEGINVMMFPWFGFVCSEVMEMVKFTSVYLTKWNIMQYKKIWCHAVCNKLLQKANCFLCAVKHENSEYITNGMKSFNFLFRYFHWIQTYSSVSPLCSTRNFKHFDQISFNTARLSLMLKKSWRRTSYH